MGKFNTIYFGPPGSGKSYLVKTQIAADQTDSDFIFRTTFFEDFSYYDFVGQYKPIVHKDYSNKIAFKEDIKESEKEPAPVISYAFVPGPFINSYVKATQNPDKQVFLVIEEINRGNCASIFGDIFQLLDRNENGSEYPIRPSQELKEYLVGQKTPVEYVNQLNLPNNLKIIATMNTSDQGLFPMDSAFKRRWHLEYCAINYDHEKLKDVLIEGTKHKWLQVIKAINSKIFKDFDNEDKQIGPWFLATMPGDSKKIAKSDFQQKLLSYLYFDVYKHKRSNLFGNETYSDLLKKDVSELIKLLIQG